MAMISYDADFASIVSGMKTLRVHLETSSQERFTEGHQIVTRSSAYESMKTRERESAPHDNGPQVNLELANAIITEVSLDVGAQLQRTLGFVLHELGYAMDAGFCGLMEAGDKALQKVSSLICLHRMKLILCISRCVKQGDRGRKVPIEGRS